MKLYLPVFILFVLASCGVQKQMAVAKATSAQTKKMVAEETARLDSIKKVLDVKAADYMVDSVLNSDVQAILNKLNDKLNSAQQLALVMDMSTQSRAAFKKGVNSSNILTKLIALDSFNTLQKRREEVYSMLKESVSTTKYKMFHYAAFFDPGVYRIPVSAMASIRSYFTPIIDSLSQMSNKYAVYHVKRGSYLWGTPIPPRWHRTDGYIKNLRGS